MNWRLFLKRVWSIMKSATFWGGLSSAFGGLGGSPAFGYLPDKVAGALIIFGTMAGIFGKAIQEKWFEVQE